jgi:Tol biopolymer transport system component
MRLFFSIVLLFSILQSYAQTPKSFDYCYSNNKGIYVYSIAEKKEYPVTKNGTDPCISPDGTKVAFTTTSPKGERHIAVIDLATMKTTIFNTNNNNCYGPSWSPDGQYIAYNAFIKNTWFIAIIDKDNHAPIVITHKITSSTGSYSPTWAANSKKLLIHNMDSIFVVTTTGIILNKYPIAGMIDITDVSSDTKFLLPADETKLVFNAEVDEQGFDGPPGAIFVYDRNTKKTLRVTPKGYYCFEPILKAGKIFFAATKVKSKIDNIYSVDMDGKNLKLEFSNQRDFTSKKEN